jgi:hypothetical protein
VLTPGECTAEAKRKNAAKMLEGWELHSSVVEAVSDAYAPFRDTAVEDVRTSPARGASADNTSMISNLMLRLFFLSLLLRTQ